MVRYAMTQELLHGDISKISEMTELAKDLKKTLHFIFEQA